jgi:hypothetical protein
MVDWRRRQRSSSCWRTCCGWDCRIVGCGPELLKYATASLGGWPTTE